MQKSPRLKVADGSTSPSELFSEAAWLKERAMRSSSHLVPAFSQHNGHSSASNGYKKPQTHFPHSPPRPPSNRSPAGAPANSWQENRPPPAPEENTVFSKEDEYVRSGRRTNANGAAPLSFMQLQMLSFILVFCASGLVPVMDMAFVVFASLYTAVLALMVLPAKESTLELDVWTRSKIGGVYNFVGSILGLFLPLAYVLGGFARSDQQAVLAATPHLFLLACQTLSENVVSEWPTVALPVRTLLSILYNAKRLFTLSSWITLTKSVVLKADGRLIDQTIATAGSYWPLFGKVLAVTNAVFWTFNLFGLLVPVMLPRSFQKHLEMELKGRESPTAPALPLQLKPEGLQRMLQSSRYHASPGSPRKQEAVDRTTSSKSM